MDINIISKDGKFEYGIFKRKSGVLQLSQSVAIEFMKQVSPLFKNGSGGVNVFNVEDYDSAYLLALSSLDIVSNNLLHNQDDTMQLSERFDHVDLLGLERLTDVPVGWRVSLRIFSKNGTYEETEIPIS